MKTIRMVQTTPHKWQLETIMGHVITANITAHNESEAKDYATRYISSYHGWNVNIIPLILEENAKVIKK